MIVVGFFFFTFEAFSFYLGGSAFNFLFTVAFLSSSATCGPLMFFVKSSLKRLQRQEGTTSGDLKPTCVCNALTESRRLHLESIEDSKETLVETSLKTRRWDKHICCWQHIAIKPASYCQCAFDSLQPAARLGPFKLNGRLL